MNRRSSRALWLLGAAALFAPASAPALPGNPAAPAPTAPADALPTLESDVPGEEKSPVPTAKEWAAAAAFAPSRTSPAAASCASTRVREWVRVRCRDKTFALSLLGGSNEGLAFWIGPESEGQFGEVQFPVRRGDERVVQFWTLGAQGGTPVPGVLLQEQWVEGEASPTLTVL